MTKTRNFSIFLIKKDKSIDDLFIEDGFYDVYNHEVSLEHCPEGAAFFLIENLPRSPWWVEYFTLKQKIEQAQHGAIYVLPVSGRIFCICFGMVAHFLEDDAYEYDFGLRVTLNSIDPKKLKSTDTVVTGPSRRERTQIPLESDLTYFDFDYESDVLKSLTGKVKDEYKHLFRHATGASNLKIGSASNFSELPVLCAEILELYEKNDFEQAFPGLRNISPVKDPSVLAELNNLLLNAIREESDELNLMVPDIINYNSNVYASFSGSGISKLYNEVYIGSYYSYLKERGIDVSVVTLDEIKKHRLCLADENESVYQHFSIMKCFVFDASHKGETYHLRERQWYRVDAEYIAEIRTFLDPHMGVRILPDYVDKREGDYNKRVADSDPKIICMDTKSISPIKSNEIEPCDLYTVENDYRVFIHVKISTLSATLSHLFNQGINPVRLVKTNKNSQELLEKIISTVSGKDAEVYAIKSSEFDKIEVCFAIVTRKDPAARSDNFPLFSRISLMRTIRSLLAMSVNVNYIFVKDSSPKLPAKSKPRKSKKKELPKSLSPSEKDKPVNVPF